MSATEIGWNVFCEILVLFMLVLPVHFCGISVKYLHVHTYKVVDLVQLEINVNMSVFNTGLPANPCGHSKIPMTPNETFFRLMSNAQCLKLSNHSALLHFLSLHITLWVKMLVNKWIWLLWITGLIRKAVKASLSFRESFCEPLPSLRIL